jgi:hypothetical protein
MKRVEAAALAILGIAVMIFGLFFCLNPFRIPYTHTVNLDPLAEWDTDSGPRRGETVEGYLTVTGGNEEAWLTIEDPNGFVIDYVGVNRRINFAFTAEYEGTYVFRVSNSQQDAAKSISFTEQKIVRALNLEFWLLVVGAGAFSLALGLIGYFSEMLVLRRQIKTPGVPPPPPPL